MVLRTGITRITGFNNTKAHAAGAMNMGTLTNNYRRGNTNNRSNTSFQYQKHEEHCLTNGVNGLKKKTGVTATKNKMDE